MNIPALVLSLLVIKKVLNALNRKRFDEARAQMIAQKSPEHYTASYRDLVITILIVGSAELLLIYLAVRIGL